MLDLRLDGTINKEVYSNKEKELNEKIENIKKEKELNVIRFILKTGESYETNFVDRREKLARKKLEKNMVPKGKEKVF